MLVEFEREHTRLLERNEELEMNIKQLRQLELRSRNNEQKVQDLQRRLRETEKLRRDLEGKVSVFFFIIIISSPELCSGLAIVIIFRPLSVCASARPSVC